MWCWCSGPMAAAFSTSSSADNAASCGGLVLTSHSASICSLRIFRSWTGSGHLGTRTCRPLTWRLGAENVAFLVHGTPSSILTSAILSRHHVAKVHSSEELMRGPRRRGRPGRCSELRASSRRYPESLRVLWCQDRWKPGAISQCECHMGAGLPEHASSGILACVCEGWRQSGHCAAPGRCA